MAPAHAPIDKHIPGRGRFALMTNGNPTTAADGVTVLIPVFNEEGGIGAVIESAREALAGRTVEVLVVDDGSTDETAARARAAGATVISHPENRGYGAAIKTGLRRAAHETIILTDGDGTYPSNAMPELLAMLGRFDMAVGARRGARVSIPLERRPAKWLLTRFAEYLAGRRIPDLNSGLRAFRRADALRFINLYPSGFSLSTTITLAYLSSELSIGYLNIDYHPRVGRSKIRPLRDTQRMFATVLRCTLFFNPLRVCLPLATVMFVAAMIILFGFKDAKGNVYDGTVSVLTLGAIQIVIVGFIADMMARMR